MIYGNSILDCNDHTDPRDPEYDDEESMDPPLIFSAWDMERYREEWGIDD